MKKPCIALTFALPLFLLQGCVGTIIGATTDAAIAVAKVPFKVGGAIYDGVAGGDKKDK